MILQPGDIAPQFTLRDTTKKETSLSDFRGQNVLLLFFPLAFTSVCTKELCEVRDHLSFYNNLDAVVFGISVDSPQTLARYKEDQLLNFELLSDFNREASQGYGALYSQFGWMKGVSKRAAFLVDREGRLTYAEVKENAAELPDFEAIKQRLINLKER